MVDVGGKAETVRRAVAEGYVTIPVALESMDGVHEWWSPKGPVFQTAIVAGIQGAKATATTIPLCHPLPLSSCTVTVEPAAPSHEDTGKPATIAGSAERTASTSAVAESTRLVVRCTVETTARTGVEMEALCGVSAACLTVYDMGKSVTHGIAIGPIELVEKTGGKSDWHRD